MPGMSWVQALHFYYGMNCTMLLLLDRMSRGEFE